MNPLRKILNYAFPVVNPLTGAGQQTYRTDNDPKHAERYIAKVQLQRIRQDVISWREAIVEAEHAWFPHRVQMQRLFNDTVLNGHVYACMEKRKQLTLLKKFELIDEKGEIDEFWTEKMKSKWVTDLINYSLDAIFYGYNLINFSGITDDKLDNVHIIKRHNVSPDRLQLVSYTYALQGIQFLTEEPFKDWLIYVDTPTESGISNCGYGLLYRVGIYEIMLRNLLGYNGDFVELYSQPFRYAKTQKTNEDERGELENMLQNLGSSGYGIFDPMDEVGFLEAKNSGTGFLGYDNLEKRCEAKISKIILGHADAMDSTAGKLGGRDEAVKEALEVIEKNDNRFVTNVMNEKVIPLMRLHGISIPENLTFAFCNDKELAEEDEKKNKRNKEFIDGVKTLFDAGYKVDSTQIEEITGLKLTEIEQPQEKLSMDVQNKLNELYGSI
jgi:hypothetical protein